jgi:predicted PurR-regulated permease PerM
VALYLGFNDHWIKALLLGIWGSVVVSTIDNFLFPVLVGTRLQLHTAAILVSVLGGIALVGLPGIVLGPVTLTVARVLLEIWHARTTQVTLSES